MSFLSFFHTLIAEGIIPYGNYAFLAHNNGQLSGECGEIRSNDFITKCIRDKLVDESITEGAYLKLTGTCLESFQHTFLLSFKNNKWEITRAWKSTHKFI